MGAATERIEESAAKTALIRREVALDMAAQGTGWALEQLTDEEFKRLLELDKVREERTKQIILNRLQAGVDYGSVPGISKPFAWESTGDSICKLFRWSARLMSEPHLTYADGVLTATVEAGIHDGSGRLLGTVTRSCSTMERRFQNQRTKQWKFNDPREATNECVAMAFKRAKLALTLSVSGAKKFFSNPEQLEDDEDVAEKEQEAIGAMATRLVDLLKAKGFKTKQQYTAFVEGALGVTKPDTDLTRDDYQKMIEAAAALPDSAGTHAAPANGSASPAKVRCQDCNGTGRDDADDTGACQICMGTGKVRPPVQQDPRD